jgi:hypothetical protein
MAKHLLSKEKYKEKNIVFSPVSLQIVLSIIAAGCEGPTQQQLMSFLQFESVDKLKSLCSQLVFYVLADNTTRNLPISCRFSCRFGQKIQFSCEFGFPAKTFVGTSQNQKTKNLQITYK